MEEHGAHHGRLVREPAGEAAYEANTTNTKTVDCIVVDGVSKWPTDMAAQAFLEKGRPREAPVDIDAQFDGQSRSDLNPDLTALFNEYDDVDEDEMSLVRFPDSRDSSPLLDTKIESEPIPAMDEITVKASLPEMTPSDTIAALPLPPPPQEQNTTEPPPLTDLDISQMTTPTKQPGCPETSSPLSEPLSVPGDVADLLDLQTSPEQCSSPITGHSPASSPLSELDMVEIGGCPVDYDFDGPLGHRLLRLKPTAEQWDDFPALLGLARQLHAEVDGCFKIVLPEELREPIPEKPAQRVPANAYKVRQIRQRMFWQVSTMRTEGVFSSSEPEAELADSVEVSIKNLKTLFNKNKEKQMRHVRYRVDVPAWTAKQRRDAGVPERSPIHPLKGDKLEHTKAIIPGIHTPYVYESGPHFGATFQFHAEDFRLSSLNHLYKGRKIWIVIPSTAVDIAEKALNRKGKCSQFMRHRAEFFFPERLEKMGIPYRIVDQHPGETIVILPDAYHQGFSTGYTLAEAKNYADPDWTADSYQPCEAKCQLATAIPAEFMRPLMEGEQRLDLCADYGDGGAALQQPEPEPQLQQQQQPSLISSERQSTLKRSHEEQEEINGLLLDDRNAKQLKVN